MYTRMLFPIILLLLSFSCSHDSKPTRYSVSGTLSGLADSEITLMLNGIYSLTLDADGSFSFGAELNDNTGYDIVISESPLWHRCQISNETGSIQGANVDNVSVQCNFQTVFASDRDNIQGDVFIMDNDGGNVVNLTQAESYDDYPKLNPVKEQIIFISDRDGEWNVHSMDAAGTDVTNLTFGETTEFNPVVSPDGNKIVYHYNSGAMEFNIMDSDGANNLNLSNNDAYDWAVSFSPDSSFVLFETYRDGNLEVYRINSDGSNPVNLTNNEASDSYPVISPDGTQIAFLSDRNGETELFLMDVDGGNPHSLAPDFPGGESIYFSNDAKSLFFHSNVDGNIEIYSVNVGGGIPLNLSNSDFYDYVIGHRASTILYITNQDGNTEIYSMNEDGSNQVNLTNNDATDTWSLD